MLVGLNFSMHFMDETRNPSHSNSDAHLKTTIYPGSVVLRRAIRGNIVSFPSQIPVFLKHPPAGTQWRVVLLFFVRGWSPANIAARFNVPRHRVWRLLNDWSVRALALGCIQVIDPEAFATCCRMPVEEQKDDDSGEIFPPENEPMDRGVSSAFSQAARVEGTPVDCLEKSTDLIAVLDAAIARCEEWHYEFRVPAVPLVRDLRTAEAIALQLRRSIGQANRLPPALPAERVISN